MCEKKLFLLSISILMRIFIHIELLLFYVSVKYTLHFVEFYNRNGYKTKKQPHNLQTTIHGCGER